MKKYTLELSEEQMHLVARCLEDISRFASGQTELNNTLLDMHKDLSFDEYLQKGKPAEHLLKQVKNVLFPNFEPGQSLGYNSTDFIGNVYQIYRTMYYQLAIDNNWNNVYSSPALPSGNLGSVKIKKI